MPHRWRNESQLPVRWARDAGARAAVCLPGGHLRRAGPDPGHGALRQARPELVDGLSADIDVRDPRDRYFGKITPSQMDPTQQSQDLLEVTASMRTALLVYGGINVKMMVDSDLGAQLSTMFMVQYDPDGATGPHDHPFEETYFFLEGEAEATFDGKPVVLGAGDIAWAGVGCPHSFRNLGTGRCGGWRPRRRSHRGGIPIGSLAIGTT